MRGKRKEKADIYFFEDDMRQTPKRKLSKQQWIAMGLASFVVALSHSHNCNEDRTVCGAAQLI